MPYAWIHPLDCDDEILIEECENRGFVVSDPNEQSPAHATMSRIFEHLRIGDKDKALALTYDLVRDELGRVC
jgi:hypothetical protein